MKRALVFLYGLVAYFIFFGTILYAIGFTGNIVVPKGIDSGLVGPLGTALAVNAVLLTLFAVQHSGMARRGFKRFITRYIPQAAERSTFVLLASVCLLALFVFWRPLGGVIWDIQNSAGRIIMYSLFAFGWVLVFAATFMINHFDLFGLRQVYLYARGREYKPLPFRTPWLYKYVRHPLYVGFFFAMWFTPTMTIAHLVFAVACTGYIVIATQFEERDLVEAHGETYRKYREQVPMYIPKITTEAKLKEALSQ
jgi:protein-S-isoprenylcysteine O-methyltransferase Ste14